MKTGGGTQTTTADLPADWRREMKLSEMIDDAVAGYAEGAWVTETRFEKRMVLLLMDASKRLKQLEAELAKEKETLPYTVKCMSEDEWFRECSPKNYGRLKELAAITVEIPYAIYENICDKLGIEIEGQE